MFEVVEDEEKFHVGLLISSGGIRKYASSTRLKLNTGFYSATYNVYMKVYNTVLKDYSKPRSAQKNIKALRRRYPSLYNIITDFNDNWDNIHDIFPDLLNDARDSTGKRDVFDYYNDNFVIAVGRNLDSVKDEIRTEWEEEIALKKDPYKYSNRLE